MTPMEIQDIFLKDVSRRIEGVVKADDTENLKVEVEEYVFTNDAAKWVAPMLEDYVNNDLNNGVWISGFFGSGKSHLLKMLAHLLGDVEGQDFDRRIVADAFAEKTDEELLKATLKRVSTIPAKSILFNIDMKANIVAKEKEGALLGIFYKVFDEMRGYYGNDRAVARFEESLDQRNLLDKFQDAFEKAAGYSWKMGRESWSFDTEFIDAAYQEVTGKATTEVFRSFERTDEQTTIEGFAHDVKKWLDMQPEGTRINFFVDEVGQFIGDNVSLMLNLQTLVEALHTITNRRAWVFVTSQEDMEKVIGDRTKSQQNDFSKIQARFQHRVKLSSQDVEEVISKRLLRKNAEATPNLTNLYDGLNEHFRTMFEFTDGAKIYRNYDSRDRFLNNYPFVTYQFDLFRDAIQGLSDHNAFEGRNSSVGERSMLWVVQEVAKKLSHSPVGTLVTFDQMLDGISAALKSALTRSIGQAQANLESPDQPEIAELAIKVLKALFLVKYVDSFKATPRNLVVLLRPALDCDTRAYTKNIESALQLLESQSYVQRTGNIYEFLTDEEQEIEKEIKNIDLDQSERTKKLFEWIQNDVVGKNRITYHRNGRIFDFEYMIDGNTMTRTHNLGIDFLTPDGSASFQATYEQALFQSRGQRKLIMLLGEDERRLMFDLGLWLKTEKYIKQRTQSQLAVQTQAILATKQSLNSEREKELIDRLKHAIGHATAIVNGSPVEISSHDPKSRIDEGFQELIDRTYTQMRGLGDRLYTEKDIHEILDDSQNALPMAVSDIYKEPAKRVEDRIAGLRSTGTVTITTLVEEFENPPYGWDSMSVRALLAWLLAEGTITLTLDGNQILRSDAEAVLLNSSKLSKVIVALQKHFDPKQIKALREFYQEFFATAASMPSDPMELARATVTQLKEMQRVLLEIAENDNFPFAKELEAPLDLIKRSLNTNLEWYLTDFDTRDELLDVYLDTIEDLLPFVNGEGQRKYLDTKNWFTANRADIEEVDSDRAGALLAQLQDSGVFRGRRLQQLIETKHELDVKLAATRAGVRTEVEQQIDTKRLAVENDPHFTELGKDDKERIIERFEYAKRKLQPGMSIAQLRHLGNRFFDTEYRHIVTKLAQAGKTVPVPPQPVIVHPDCIIEPDPNPIVAPAQRETIPLQSIDVKYRRVILESEADIDGYLASLRDELIQTISNGKAIAL